MEQAELIQPIRKSICQCFDNNNIKYGKITENWCTLWIILNKHILFSVNYDDDRDFYHIKFRNRKTDIEIDTIIKEYTIPYPEIDKIINELVNKYLDNNEINQWVNARDVLHR